MSRIISPHTPRVTVVVGMHWGDEGKGKVIDYLAEKYDVIARCQGGPNAGHTIYRGGKPFVLQLVPSGIFYPAKTEIIGNGTVINLNLFCEEVKKVRELGGNLSGLYVSDRAHIIPQYIIDKELQRASAKGIDTTKQGIGDSYAAKANRIGIRVGDLAKPFSEVEALVKNALEELGVSGDAKAIAEEQIRLYKFVQENTGGVVQTSYLINDLIDVGRSVLVEGAQGTLLDIDHGTYPYVTSSNCTAGGAATGLGIGPDRVTDIIGIMKAYITRVGNGPFITELGTPDELARERALKPDDPEALELRQKVLRGEADPYEIGRYKRILGQEFGSRTGRPRRTGWQDLMLNDYATMVNNLNSVIVTKLDIEDEFPELKIAVSYRTNDQKVPELPTDLNKWKGIDPVYLSLRGLGNMRGAKSFNELPDQALSFLEILESSMRMRKKNLRIIGASVGPEREHLLMRAA